MNRVLVAVLAAVDALIAAAVGVAVVLAPLTVLWVFGLGGDAEWAALWPAAVRIWQLGELVPLHVVLPTEYLTATGIPPEAATFVVSLAPLAFAASTAIFASRSGARAARAGAWITGVLSGTVVTGVLSFLFWLTSANPVALVYGWQALGMPTAVFAVSALLGAVVAAWRVGDDGLVDAVRSRIPRRWEDVPAASARGIAVSAMGFVGVGALLVVVATVVRGGEVIALFEAAHVDAIGATVIALGQLAYLPTLIVWGGAFAAGPGFAIGTGTAVSPAGTNLGVLPGIPALGLVPTSVSSLLLLLVLLVIAVGFMAGAAARVALLAGRRTEETAPRAATLVAIVLGSAASVAVLAALASGSMGPGRLEHAGPAPGSLALAVGLEVLIGATIGLFAPVRRDGRVRAAAGQGDEADDTDAADAADVTDASEISPPEADEPAADDTETENFAASDLDPLRTLPEDDPGERDTTER